MATLSASDSARHRSPRARSLSGLLKDAGSFGLSAWQNILYGRIDATFLARDVVRAASAGAGLCPPDHPAVGRLRSPFNPVEACSESVAEVARAAEEGLLDTGGNMPAVPSESFSVRCPVVQGSLCNSRCNSRFTGLQDILCYRMQTADESQGVLADCTAACDHSWGSTGVCVVSGSPVQGS